MVSFSTFILCTLVIIVSSSANIIVKSSLDKAVEQLKIKNNPNIILVIGNTGSGISTLVHYAAGDYSKLSSVESRNPNDFNFEIKDELDPKNSTIISSTVSRTLIPEMVIDDDENVWYDCPGFTDTRNETVEITNAALIKRVIESASNIKIVMIVQYESVIKGHDRTDFDNFLKYTTQLIKRVGHFRDSLSLVVTKAPSYNVINRHIVDISEENVQNTTAEFLLAHKLVLYDKSILAERVLLIDALLKKSEGSYPKISVFWKPDEAGKLNEIDKFVKSRARIRESILNNTIYAPIQAKDFGFPLSTEAQLYIKKMVEQAKDSLLLQLQNINNRVQSEVNRGIQPLHDYKRMLEIVHVGQSKLEYYKQMDAINFKNLTKLFRELIKEIGLQSIDEQELRQIERDENNLNWLKSFVDDANIMISHANSIDYKSLLYRIYVFFKNLESNIQNNILSEIQQIMNNISVSLASIDQQLLTAIHEKLKEKSDIQSKLDFLHIGKKSVESIGKRANVTKELTMEQRIEVFSTLIRDLNITSFDVNVLNRTKENGLHLKELMSLSKSQNNIQTTAPAASSIFIYCLEFYIGSMQRSIDEIETHLDSARLLHLHLKISNEAIVKVEAETILDRNELAWIYQRRTEIYIEEQFLFFKQQNYLKHRQEIKNSLRNKLNDKVKNEQVDVDDLITLFQELKETHLKEFNSSKIDNDDIFKNSFEEFDNELKSFETTLNDTRFAINGVLEQYQGAILNLFIEVEPYITKSVLMEFLEKAHNRTVKRFEDEEKSDDEILNNLRAQFKHDLNDVYLLLRNMLSAYDCFHNYSVNISSVWNNKIYSLTEQEIDRKNYCKSQSMALPSSLEVNRKLLKRSEKLINIFGKLMYYAIEYKSNIQIQLRKKQYRHYATKKSWFEANEYCLKNGERLVAIRSEGEWQDLVNYLTSVGYSDAAIWTSGQRSGDKFYWFGYVAYDYEIQTTKWGVGEPDNSYNCVFIRNGQLYTHTCYIGAQYILCEY
ncbi:uncharacterized protein LOC116347463 [Contarinia nasturtii]|uniref:uncharacterized protein LOC116347463 n=1 Tax=Contarinia nasturtii TaxID=265458 RepID=UPI0012D48536|nr:uncharacterized protein LOC116347463 [Contarinia nasturtii]